MCGVSLIMVACFYTARHLTAVLCRLGVSSRGGLGADTCTGDSHVTERALFAPLTPSHTHAHTHAHTLKGRQGFTPEHNETKESRVETHYTRVSHTGHTTPGTTSTVWLCVVHTPSTS